MFYKKQELITLREHMGSPQVFGGVRVTHLFRLLCVLCFCALFVFVLCLVRAMLPMSLDCPFLVVQSVFFNVDFRQCDTSIFFLFIYHYDKTKIFLIINTNINTKEALKLNCVGLPIQNLNVQSFNIICYISSLCRTTNTPVL